MKIGHFNLLLLMMLWCALDTSAHQGSIRGIVYDGSRSLLSGASIAIDSTAITVTTDAFGKFFLKGIDPGRHTIVIRYLGYEAISGEIAVEDGETTELTYHMIPATVKMPDISISASKDLKLTSISLSEGALPPVNNTQDLLRLVPGLFLAQHQGGGKAEQIFIRGFDCDHGTDITISVDNMPVNMVSHAHGQGFADAHFIIPESIQQLDYGKGPYEANKGNFYTAGYVAFKTKNGLENNFVTVEGGQYDYLRTAAGFNLLDSRQGIQRKSNAYILGEYVYSRGYFDAPQNLNRFNLMGKYVYNISPDKRLSLTLSGFHSFWNASGLLPERAMEQGIVDLYGTLDKEGGGTSRYNINLEYFQSVHNESYLKSNVYFTRYNFLLYSNFTFFAGDSVNGDQIKQAENRTLCGYNTEYTNNAAYGSVQFKTQVGAGLRFDNIANDELSHTADESLLLNRIAYGNVEELNLSGYVSEKITLLTNLTVNAGLRYDLISQQYFNKLGDKAQAAAVNSRVSPKAGICYSIGTNTRLYYSYGTGFHTNDTRANLLGQQLGGYVSVGNTIPRAFSHDLGIEHTFGSTLTLSAALWRLDLEQEFGYSGDAAVIDTSGRTRRYGVDFSARYRFLKNVSLFIDVNFAHGRFIDQAEHNYIPLAPTLISTGGIKYAILKNISAGVYYRHMSDRPANNDNSHIATGYTLFDAAVSYHVHRFEYSLQIQNLLNTKWREAQFETETRLRSEVMAGTPAQTDICFTPGIPFFMKLTATYKF